MLHEIDERTSDNLRVTLYWEDADDTLTVEVEDFRDSANDLTLSRVPKGDRKQAFLHPFAYQPKAVAA